MIPPGSGIFQLLADYERELRAERASALRDEAKREAAEREIEALLDRRHDELLARGGPERYPFDATW